MRYDCINYLHTYGESMEVQGNFHLNASVKAKKLLEDVKDG